MLGRKLLRAGANVTMPTDQTETADQHPATPSSAGPPVAVTETRLKGNAGTVPDLRTTLPTWIDIVKDCMSASLDPATLHLATISHNSKPQLHHLQFPQLGLFPAAEPTSDKPILSSFHATNPASSAAIYSKLSSLIPIPADLKTVLEIQFRGTLSVPYASATFSARLPTGNKTITFSGPLYLIPPPTCNMPAWTISPHLPPYLPDAAQWELARQAMFAQLNEASSSQRSRDQDTFTVLVMDPEQVVCTDEAGKRDTWEVEVPKRTYGRVGGVKWIVGRSSDV